MPIDLQQGVSDQFDYQRKKAAQQEAANLQGQKQALARRAAQLGGGPSGALIKQEQVAGDQSAQRLATANEGIDAAQTAEQRRIREIQQAQEFAHNERLGSQDFAHGERLGSQEFSHGERLGTQDFAHTERLGSQDFTAGEANKAFNRQRDLQMANQKFTSQENALTRETQQKQFDSQMARDAEKFAHEKEVDAFNEHLANKMANQKGPLDQLFGNFSMGNLSNMFGGGGGGGGGVNFFGGGGGGGGGYTGLGF